MLKNINWLGVASLFFMLLALLASATFFLFFYAIFFAIVALVLAYYSKKSRVQTATNNEINLIHFYLKFAIMYCAAVLLYEWFYADFLDTLCLAWSFC